MTEPPDPMRVLVHLNHLELGGTQLNAVDFAASLRAHSIESMLVGGRTTLPASGPSILEVAQDRGLAVELYDDAPTRMPNARMLQAIADDFGADLVHVYGSWGSGAPAAYWGPSKFGRRPWVQTVYEMSVSPIIKRHMPLIVGTGYLVDELVDRPARTILISPPVDTDADRPDVDGAPFREAHGLEGDLLVIVSRLDPNMKALSIGVAIDAMRELGARGATLAIVGAGDAEAELRERAERVNAALGRRAVVLTGAMMDPRTAYAAADVMLGMGGSAARSLAFGKPLVVQGEAGWSQLFDESTAASLARASYWSPDAVADPVGDLVAAVSPLLADPARRADLGRLGRAFAEERFSLRAMTDRMAAFYREIAGGYRATQWLADLPSEGAVLRDKLGRLGGRRSSGGAS